MVAQQLCVLGCHLQGLVRLTCNAKEVSRLQSAANCVHKISRLPVKKRKSSDSQFRLHCQ